jgi:hypothetical protein
MKHELERFFRSVESGGKSVTWQKAALSFDMSGNALRKRYKNWKSSKSGNGEKTQQDGTWVCIFDAHVPFHNRKMFESINNLIQSIRPFGLVLGGDFLDLNSLSAHDRGKVPIPGLTLGKEYAEGNSVLDVLESYPFKRKVYMWGNHEHRHNRYIKDSDNSKIRDAIKSPMEALSLIQRGYEVYESYPADEFILGDLKIYHGESFNQHCAYNDLQKIKKSVMFGHVHRQQSFHEREVEAYAIGSAADHTAPVFAYASKVQKQVWCNGLAVVTVINGKSFVETIRYKHGKIVFGGKPY